MKLKMLCYVLMMVGLVLAIGGVLAVFNFDQPADMFSFAWWMIVGGWLLVLIGMSIDIFQLFTTMSRKPLYTFGSEIEKTDGVEKEVTRV